VSTSRSKADWEAIEREYRAGQLSIVEIGRQHKVSHTAINKRAKRDGWKRDLTKQVQREVSARLVSAEVSPEVSAANAKEAVGLAAERGVVLVLQHRKALSRSRAIAEKLFNDLERLIDGADEIEAAIVAETAQDKDSQRRNAMLKAVSLPSRAATLRELSQVLKNTLPLERQAFNLDKGGEDEDGVQIIIFAEDQAV
jgi:hypothetical protein